MISTSMGPAEFGVSPFTGFLPEQEPLHRLPVEFDDWEGVALDLPKHLVGDSIRRTIEELHPCPIQRLSTPREWERAMVMLSYLGHAYVWGGERPAGRLPSVLAAPWHKVASRLGRPPVLSYASYCLHNWRKLRPDGPIEAGNLALIQNFLAGQDEEWFVLIHADIEMRAAPAVSRLLELSTVVGAGDEEATAWILSLIASSLGAMNRTMDRMPEGCDPYIYFHRVRPYIHGWRNHPDLPEGVVYEGVAEYDGKPQTFRGETGAQSGIIPALDAVLGIGHAPDELRSYLMEMRQYMPAGHRAFVEELEAGPSVREFAAKSGRQVREFYNECVAGIERFRSTHLRFAASYIHKQAQDDPKNPTDVGTGGTPFMPYLKKHRDETASHAL